MMKSVSAWKQELADGVYAARLASLYCCAPEETSVQAARYAAVLDGLENTFGAHAGSGDAKVVERKLGLDILQEHR